LSLSYQKYGFAIQDLIFRIRKPEKTYPDPGFKAKKAPDPGSATLIWIKFSSFCKPENCKKKFLSWPHRQARDGSEEPPGRPGTESPQLNIIIIFNFHSTKIISNNGSWRESVPVWGGNLTIYIPQSPVPTVDLFEKLDKTYLKRVAWKNHAGNEGLTIWFRIHEKNEKKFGKSTPVTSNTDFRHEW
jgi:hypothetical protein